MYGGVIIMNGSVSAELFQYNTTGNKWKQLSLITKGWSPIAVAGHTAQCISVGGSPVMFVIFGHNPFHGYMNTVQRYDTSEHPFIAAYVTLIIILRLCIQPSDYVSVCQLLCVEFVLSFCFSQYFLRRLALVH
jgi:hypothetical protein